MRRFLAAALALAIAVPALGQTAGQWRSFGPFSGFIGSVPRHSAPMGAIVDGDSSRNFLYDATEKKLIRRKGTTNLDSAHVEAAGSWTWNARARQVTQIDLPQLTYPTVAALYNDDTDSLGTLIWRGSGATFQLGADKAFGWNNYTGDAAKPNSDGASFIMTPLWTERGLTRAQTADQRAVLAAGSRSVHTAGNWLFLPNALGTPAMWSKRYGTSAGAGQQTMRLRPWGHAVAMYPPDFPAASYPSRQSTERAWKEGDQFFVSVIFQFEDGSFSPPLIPDLTTIAIGGLGGASGLVVVNDDGDADEEYFDYIPWRNIPVGPHGTVARVLCRTPKVSKDTGTLPGFRDLRISAIIPNNTQCFYDDPNGDDNALVVNNEVVRFDHMWPKRARYVIANDARTVICGAVQPNPAALFLAPTGITSSRDLNNNLTTGAGYTDVDSMTAADIIPTNVALGFKVSIHASDPAQDSLVLVKWIKTTGYTQTAFALRGHRSVRSLVEAINATTTSSGGEEWAAQVIPGADDEAPAWKLKSTATIDLGDSTRFGGANGIQWVRSPSWPGVVYFNDDLNDDLPLDHQALYFTGANPGHAQSAPLNFYVGNRRAPPSRAAGKCLGGAPLRDRFVICYENAVYVLRNARGGGTGLDDDYRLVPLNESRGCVSPSSITSGDGWVGYMTRDGYVVTDSENELLISRDVWDREKEVGEWAWEMKKSGLAIAADTDNSFFNASRLGSQLHISYRKDTTATMADRRLVYDFSGSSSASGLAEMTNGNATYGWSTPLTTSVSAMGEAVMDAGGPYRLGAIESNTRGRLDKFDTGNQDGGSSIRAIAHTPTDFAETYNMKAADQVLAVYKKPEAGLSVTYYRDSGRSDAYTTTLASSASAIFTRAVADLQQAARGPTPVFELKLVDHSSGEGSEVWTLALKYRVLDTVR